MSITEQIQIFEDQQIRTVWDDEQEKWFFSVVDVVGVLTDSVNPTDYLKKMRKREPELGIYLGTNCPQVLMTTPTGRNRKTLAGTTEHIFRLIQSIPTKEYKHFKGLKKESLRDNMTNMELLLNALAEESATELSKERNPQGLEQTTSTAQEGAEVAKTARDDFEKRLGHSIISPERAIDHTLPQDQLPLNKQPQDKQDPFFENPK